MILYVQSNNKHNIIYIHNIKKKCPHARTHTKIIIIYEYVVCCISGDVVRCCPVLSWVPCCVCPVVLTVIIDKKLMTKLRNLDYFYDL